MANSGGGSDMVQVPPGDSKLSVSPITVTKGVQIAGTGGAATTTIEQLSAGTGIFAVRRTPLHIGSATTSRTRTRAL
jgi:hypothetical protein